jgi:hypothetical protein
MKFSEKEFCISSPFYFLLPVFFRHVQSTPLVFWYTSCVHDTVDRPCSKNSVRESKYCIFKCHVCLISGTAQLYCILPEAVILMSSYLSRIPISSFVVVSNKIILSSRHYQFCILMYGAIF